MNHLSDEQLFSEAAPPLTPGELAHLDTCPRCRMERLRYDRSLALAVESGVVATLVGLNDEIGHSLVSSLTAEWWCDGFGTLVQSDGLDWWRHERRAIDGDASDRAGRVHSLGVAGLVPWRVEGSVVFSRWYPGVTLDRALDREPAETAQRFAARILEDVAVLLQRLHAGGLAHGAVRPSRVLVRDGRGALLLSGLTPGNPRSDRAAFQRMAQELLGVAVPTGLRAAHHTIVDHELSLVFRDPRPDRSDNSRRGLIVGRAQESADLKALVRGGVRLVSVLGPPGIGKTAFLEHVLPTVGPFLRLDATSLTTSLVGGSEPRSILALDGIDDAIDLAARRIAEWLEHTEHTIVVAAEQPLRLRGEQVLRLGPLDPESSFALFRQAAHGSDVRSLLELAGGVPWAIELLAVAGTDPAIEGPYDRALTQSFERLPDTLQDALRMIAASDRATRAQWSDADVDDRLMELADRSWLIVDDAAGGSVSLLPPMRRWLEKRALA